jgi:hypothetical protein
MQLLTVWLPGRMQHGQAGKLFGCLGARVVLAPLLSPLMQLAHPSLHRAGLARQKRSISPHDGGLAGRPLLHPEGLALAVAQASKRACLASLEPGRRACGQPISP